MNDNLTAAKTALVGLFGALAAFLGWKGVLAVIWFVCVVLDYISGSAAAMKEGQWHSKAAREGLWHKAGMLIVVTVSVVADLALGMACKNLHLGFGWPDMLLPLVLVWYIITETGSILENAIKLGAKVPQWLAKLMKASLRAVDALGEHAGEADSPKG